MPSLTLTEPTASESCDLEVTKLLSEQQPKEYLLISKNQEIFLNKKVQVYNWDTMDVYENLLYCEMENRQLVLSVKDCESIINHSQSKKINDYLRELMSFKK